jgi:hypothetical protein
MYSAMAFSSLVLLSWSMGQSFLISHLTWLYVNVESLIRPGSTLMVNWQSV